MSLLINRQSGTVSALLICGCLASPSCLQVEPQKQIVRAHELVLESTGQADLYDPYAALLSAQEVQNILGDGLTLEEAQHLALVNGKDLQADFQEIGVAQAAWVQAQLLSNPSVDLLVGFPSGGGRTLFEALLSVELLELWRIPVRTAASQERLQATVLRLARRSGEVLAETRNAYRLAAAQAQRIRIAHEKVDLATQAMEAVQAMRGLGAADEAKENRTRSLLLEAQLQRIAAEVSAEQSMGDLAVLLSIRDSIAHVPLLDHLPSTIDAVFDSEELVDLALASRLDLQAYEREIQAMQLELKDEGRGAWGNVTGSAYLERPAQSGAQLHGPGLGLTLPLFDQNQAQIARASFRLEQLKHTHASAQVSVAQTVRQEATRVNGAAQALRLHAGELLPLATRHLELAETAYVAGTLDLEGWLAAQARLLKTRAALVDLQLEAATALANLERALGRQL